VKITVSRIPGKAIVVNALPLDTIESVLKKAKMTTDFNRDSILVGDKRLNPGDLDSVCGNITNIVITRNILGEAPTPKIAAAKKYLLKMGCIEKGGKGDHSKFTCANGKIFVLNAHKRDSKHLDLGSAKSMAKHLNLSLADLYAEIN